MGSRRTRRPSRKVTRPDDQIAAAADRLRAGRVVAFPTETVYGLGADALNEAAVARVFELKGRPSVNPLIVHVDGPAMARQVAGDWPDEADQLAEAFWPGPLTMVLPKGEAVPDVVTAGGPTVAVRAPDHAVTLDLIGSFGGPIVGPSANRSGGISPTRAAHVQGVWPDDDVLVLDGGPCRAGIESTVLDLAHRRVLRPGVIGAGEIAAVIGAPVDSGGRASGPAASPGLVGPHYRPSAPCVAAGDLVDVSAAIASAGGPVVVISGPGVPVAVDPPHSSVAMPGDAEAYAAELYAALREADALSPASIVVVTPGETSNPEGAVWAAIRERLSRACG